MIIRHLKLTFEAEKPPAPHVLEPVALKRPQGEESMNGTRPPELGPAGPRVQVLDTDPRPRIS